MDILHLFRGSKNKPARQKAKKIQNQARPEPGCSLCGRKIEPLQEDRYTVLIGGPLPTLYCGVVCTKCRSLICLECQGERPDSPCKKCGAKVVPAYEDVIWTTP